MTVYVIDSAYDGLMSDKYFTTLEKANAYIAELKMEKYYYATELKGAN